MRKLWKHYLIVRIQAIKLVKTKESAILFQKSFTLKKRNNDGNYTELKKKRRRRKKEFSFDACVYTAGHCYKYWEVVEDKLHEVVRV